MESAPMQFGNWQEGSAEIRTLQAENAELREALKHVAWSNYWNGWNDCCDARNKPWWKRIFDRTPPDGGPNRPHDPENG